MTKNALAILGCASWLATAFVAASCSTTTTCAVDSSGNSVCASYASAYPYDYAYYDPVYATTFGYSPYYVDTYYDPYGYSYVFATPAPTPVADAATSGNVPEMLDKAHRAANAVDVAVRAALDPVKDLIKTSPQQNSDNIVYGPANRGDGNYQFTLRRLSESEQRFGWKLEARPASSTGSFSLVAGGLIKVGDMPRRGRGSIGVDCSAMSAADSSVTCRGLMLMGFTHTNDGDKLLNVGLKGYTPDMSVSAPMDAKMFAWRHGDTANHVRLVTHTNLSQTATSAPETVTLKLTWLKDVGVRVDAVATDGDIPAGQMMMLDTCVGADLSPTSAMTQTQMCNSDGSGCTVTAGGATAPTCAAGLTTADLPNADPAATDPPMDAPETPPEPSAMPDGSGN